MPRPGRRVLLVALVSVALATTAPAYAAPQQRGRLVVFALSGVTWPDLLDASMPALDALIDEGAVAAMSPRSVFRPTGTVRGYLTLGAGGRAYAPKIPTAGRIAAAWDASFENGTAGNAAARRYVNPRAGAIVHLGLGELRATARGPDYGTELSALGEALARAGVRRAVVSAADLAPAPRSTSTMRRESVLALADHSGVVDAGTLDGLVRTDPSGPFGVVTDEGAFVAATRTALVEAPVVLLDPGETARADEYALVAPERAGFLRRRALERTDALIARVRALLDRERDVLYVAGVSSPSVGLIDRLTPVVAWGRGVERGWLSSPTTRRRGIVALTDIAPTILRAEGVAPPSAIAGTPIRSIAHASPDRVVKLADLDRVSQFRDRFATVAIAVFVGLLGLLSVLAFLVFLWPARPDVLPHLARVCAFAVLALPAAAVGVRAFHADRVGLGGAAVVLLGFCCVLVVFALVLPGQSWTGGIALLLVSLAVGTADLLAGSPMQLNGAFGYSPVLAGRFYGLGNVGFAILLASGILGLCGLADLRGHRRPPAWLAVGLTGLVVLDGHPSLGADFGGVLALVPGVVLTYAVALRMRVRWRGVIGVATAALVLAAAATLVDLARPPETRTHLGRFASQLASDGLPALWRVVQRKGLANLGLLGTTAWTYIIPVGVAVLVLLLWRPQGVLSRAIPEHPLLRAGLWGSTVASLAGFALNDSGVAIPGMVMGHVVPLYVLLGLSVYERARAPASQPPVTARR